MSFSRVHAFSINSKNLKKMKVWVIMVERGEFSPPFNFKV